MVVAIDGPAGTGKSTIALMIAKNLGFTNINSGNFYRAISYGIMQEGIDISEHEKIIAWAKKAKFAYDDSALIMNGKNVEEFLHTASVDAKVAQVSAIIPVRHVVNDTIRSLAKNMDIVIEGRDITTVVFPNAEVKFYLDASAESRAKRRLDQGTGAATIEEVRKNLTMRDEIDKGKKEGALKIAPDADYLDSSDLTIQEVYAKVVSKIYAQGKHMDQKEVAMDEAKTSAVSIQTQLQEEYLKSLEQLEEGELIEGQVVQVADDSVFIDVGYKSEGKIPLEEFTAVPKVGDMVSVFLIRKEDRNGNLIVSKKKADEKAFWKTVNNAFKTKEPVEGTIEKVVKGGYDVNLGNGLRAFLPISQADTQKVDKPEKLIGVKSKFYIDRLYSEKKVNIVVTRRNFLEEETEKKRDDFFSGIKVGDEVQGEVKSFTSFGAFIDLGGFDGLLHINDMSWGHVTRPKDFVKKGQNIKLKVIRLDAQEKRINLSLKHFTPDPWTTFENTYHINDVVKGHVTKLTDFGAFIEIQEGIEGLAHISEFSWVKKVKKPEEVLKIGDEVQCMILGYDLEAGRVSLGLKQVTKNPWEDILSRYPVGTRVTRKIVKVTNAGAFVELEDGIDGFLHADDISWTKRIKHPGSELQVGQELEVIVIDCDAESRNIRLGIKQLSEDPWKLFCQTNKVGSMIEGEVTSITDFGIFLRVSGGIEGLLPKQNLTDDREVTYEDAMKKYTVGDKIKVVIAEIHSDKQKISFSVKDYVKKVQREEMSKFLENEEEASGYTLADVFKKK